MTDRPRHWTRWSGLAASLAIAAAGAAARADAVKLSGFWIENAAVHRIADGTLTYSTPTGGQVTRPLGEVQGLRLTAHPEIERAQHALDTGDPKAAAALLREAIRKPRPSWATQYMQRMLIEALTPLGGDDAAEATQVYLDLIATGPDPFFVPEAPVQAVAAANEATKQRVRQALNSAAARTPERYRDAVAALLVAAAAPGAAPEGSPGTTGSTAEPPAAASPIPATPPAQSAVLLPRWADEGDEVVRHLRAGDFAAALARVEERMTAPRGALARWLYLKGMAQLGLAEASGDEKRYKDAGLSFMRVVTFYAPTTAAVPPAMVEAGYVHQKIGRPDIAARLFDRARSLLDEASDPDYYQRLVTLQSSE